MSNLAKSSVPKVNASRLCELEQRLEKLSKTPRPPGKGGRVINATPGSSELLCALLQEIDETILPRRLTVTRDRGAVAQLVVANRRLVSLECAIVPAAQDLEDDPDAIAQDMARRLAGFLAPTGRVSISNSRISGADLTGTIGCSARKIARLTEIALNEAERQPPLVQLADALDTLGASWITTDLQCKPDRSNGDGTLVKQLSAQLPDIYPQVDTQLNRLAISNGLPSCTAIGCGDGTRHLIYARTPRARLLAIVSSDRVGELMRNWQAILG